MHLLWQRGPATVRGIHTWLIPDPPIGYTTVMTICARLAEKGLLERQLITQTDRHSRWHNAYLYSPRYTEQEFARTAVGRRLGDLLTHYPAIVEAHITGFRMPPRLSTATDRVQVEHLLAYLRTLRDSSGQPTEAAALDMIAALLERAEAAERAAGTSATEAARAEKRAHDSERGAQAAEQRAQTAERRAAEQRVHTLLENAGHPPPQKRVKITEPAHEYRGKICRVCARRAPPP